MKRIASVLALLVATTGMSACSATPAMDKASVEAEVSRVLTEKVGQKPDKIECPDKLEGKVGATMTCTLTHGGESLPVYLNVTSVEGTKIKFDVEVGTQ